MDEKIDQIEIIKICQEYNIDVCGISCINSGSSNRNYLIISSVGKFVLKCMPKAYYERNFVDFQNELNRTLKKRKIEFVSNISIRNQFVLEDELYYWQMRKFSSGVTELDMDSLEHIASAAKSLARLHLIEVNGEKRKIFIFEKWDKKFLPDRLVDLNRIISEYFNEVDTHEMMSHYESILSSREMEYYLEKVFSSSIIHGDYHAGNIFFENNRLVQIIDWDTARINASIYDFAKAIYLLTRFGHGIFENEFNKMEIFYDNYFKIGNLPYEELIAVPFILQVNYIPELEYLATFKGDERKIRWYLRWSYKASYMAKHRFASKYIKLIEQKMSEGTSYESLWLP